MDYNLDIMGYKPPMITRNRVFPIAHLSGLYMGVHLMMSHVFWANYYDPLDDWNPGHFLG